MKATASVLLSVFFLFLLSIPESRAQTDPKGAHLYFGHIQAACYGPDKATVELRCNEIRELLLKFQDCTEIDAKDNCAAGEALLRRLFGSTYRDTLPDYIVYFDQRGGQGKFVIGQPVLMWKNRNTPHLYGVRDIYAIVLTEHKVCLDAFVSTDYKSEPNPFSAVFSVLGSKIEPTQPKGAERHQKAQFAWYPLSGDPAMAGLWFGIARVSVDVNTTNRITVQYHQPKPPTEKDKQTTAKAGEEKAEKAKSGGAEECSDPGVLDASGKPKLGADGKPIPYTGNVLAANGFFSNSPDSDVTVSLALGATLNTRETSLASGGSNLALNGYALAKFYLVRPELRAGPVAPGYRRSWGVVVGTNIVHSPFDELIVGLSRGHLWGNVGVVAGMNSIAGKKDTQQGRKQRAFVGLDYSF